MTSPTPLLEPAAVADLLTMLLGRETTADTATRRVQPFQHPGATVATYIDDDDRLRAVIAMDLALTAFTGAAIAVMGPRVAEDAIRTTLVNQALYDNAYEVLNVTASLFNVEDAPHVRLADVYAPREFPPEPVATIVQAADTPNVTIEVDIAGYGGGRLTVLVP